MNAFEAFMIIIVEADTIKERHDASTFVSKTNVCFGRQKLLPIYVVLEFFVISNRFAAFLCVRATS